jgi:hypothetical protein
LPHVVLDSVSRELDEITWVVDEAEFTEEEREKLREWIKADGGRVGETAEAFATHATESNAVAAVTAAHAFAARLDSIAAGSVVQGGGGGAASGGVLSGAWNALKAKVTSLLQQVWNLVASLGTVTEWTLTGEVGGSVLGLGKASIAIKFT